MSTNTPATRRSTRLASQDATPAPPGLSADPVSGRTRRASATPGPSVAGNTAGRSRRGRTGATPATSGLTAFGALPPVQSLSSHAYGASGRARLVDPSSLRTSNISTDEALNSARKTALARQDATSSSRESSVVPSVIQDRPSSIPPIPEESEASGRASRQTSAVPSSRHRSVGRELPDDATNLDASRSFGLQHEAGLVPPHGFYYERPTRTQICWRWVSNKFFALRDWFDDNMPGPGTLFFVGLLSAYLLSLAFGIEIPQPDGTSLNKARESLYKSASNVAQITSSGLGALKHNAEKIAEMDRQMANQLGRYDDLSNRYDSLNAELEKLKTILPDLTVVRRKNDGDGYELLDHFWDALENKVAGQHSKGIKMPWDKWFHRNQEMVKEVQKSMTAEDYNAIMAWGLKHYSLITKDEVLDILQAHYADYDAKYAMYDRKIGQVRDFTVEAATERYLAQHLKSKQHNLIQGAWAQKTIENARMSLEEPNFMSSKLGASIDPYLTSPTAKRTYTSWQTWLFGKTLASPPPNPPIEALRSWEEAGDCWCSAASDFTDPTTPSGKAQLSILLARPVYPSHLVIEHVPKAGTLEPGTAPRDVELWAHIASPAVRDALNLQLGTASWFARCGDRGALPDEYVCIGATTYDLDGWNHVQSSRLEVDFQGLDVSVSKVVVRVRNTWGVPRVCLYRVRLLGKPA